MSSSSSSCLPQEILLEIFSRLPAKSVGKCRCLSRSWYSLLSTTEFIKTHLHISKTCRSNLILVSPIHSLHMINSLQNNSTSKELDLPRSWTEVELVGSCDGVVLLMTGDYDLFLINLITRHYVSVPESHLALTEPGTFTIHGFGYDALHNDYKIVILSYCDTDDEHEPDSIDTFVDVYSVKRRVWRRVESSPYDHAVPELSPGVFLNGALHWLATSRELGNPSVIAAFNLTDEVFSEIPVPDGVDRNKFVFDRLGILGGSLCVVGSRSSGEFHIWMMKEYGLGESWTRFSIDVDRVWDIFEPLCFMGENEVLLGTEEERLLVYNVKEGTCRDIVIHGAPTKFIDGITTVDSLVPPDFSDM